MNILHIIDLPWNSGIAHYALTLAHGLRSRGRQILIWAEEGSPPYREAQNLRLKTFSCHNRWLRLAQLRRNLLDEKIELINAHTGSGHSLAAVLAKTLPKKVPVLRTRADARPIAPNPLTSLLYRNTQGFIAANQKIHEQFSELGVSPLVTIYQGISITGINASRMGEDSNLALLPATTASALSGRCGTLPSVSTEGSQSQISSPQSLAIGMLGRLDPVKGHRHFLEAAAQVLAQFPDARFLIAGREENLKISNFAPLLSDLKLESSVDFLGHVPNAGEFMEKCAIGVIASIGSEAVSRAALEWMAAGRPLVAAKVGCLPELVEEGVTGYLVAPEDSSALALKLVRLMADSKLREEMGQNARKRVLEKFNFEKFIQETQDFYARVLKIGRN